MAKIRVLIVDDAVVVRKIVTDALSEDPDIEIVGVAANGKIAVQKLTQCNPDIVTLDVEMPELNGIETVRKIRETHPKLPIIMFSTLTERGADATLEALSAGANDYLTKPANVGSVTAAKQAVKNEMLAKIRALTRSPPLFDASKRVKIPSGVAKVPPIARPSGACQRVRMVAIGVSTGGPNALAEVLPALPADFPVPIVVVQHMPPLFTKMLAERLNTKCQLRVHEVSPGMKIQVGNIYIAQGNFHFEVKNVGAPEAVLHQGPQENSCRPAVDPLFRSVVALYGADTLGVILTGMGQDGLRGCQLIREVGGQIIAQDEQSSVVWGMPGYVVQAGLADAVLPLSSVAGELIRRVKVVSGTQESRL